MSDLRAEIRDGVLYVTLERPEKRNALSRALLRQIGETFGCHAADMSLRAAVLRGSGDKSFAAGGDLDDLGEVRGGEEARQMALAARSALDAVRAFPVPVVAALNGDALGGGAELAVACDTRIAAAHAKLGFIQGRLAIPTAWGGGIDLTALLGRRRALRLLVDADILTARSALDIGLVDVVAAEGEELDAVVERFLQPLRRQSPQVLRALKAVTSAGPDRRLAEAAEVEHFARCWVHEDHWAAHDRLMARRI